MQQKTIHISFKEDDWDLYNEIMRESALTYVLAVHCKKVYQKWNETFQNNTIIRIIKMKNIQVSPIL